MSFAPWSLTPGVSRISVSWCLCAPCVLGPLHLAPISLFPFYFLVPPSSAPECIGVKPVNKTIQVSGHNSITHHRTLYCVLITPSQLSVHHFYPPIPHSPPPLHPYF